MKSFTGAGDMLKYGKRIARVRYELETNVARVASAWGQANGISRTTGRITLLTGDSSLDIGETYSLRMEGGKVLDFFVRHKAPHRLPTARYDIYVHGDPEQ